MTSEDDTFLKAYNEKRPASSQLSEDDFEIIMDVFEETAERQAPFAAVDNTVISFDQMQTYLKQQVNAKAQGFSTDIYGYWKDRRQASGNRPLQPSLKFETHQDSDDGDPYICFRRREVRQTRKTRARDVQSAEKLRRLRKELEDGRQLVQMAHNREKTKRELLRLDKSVFDQRQRVKETKIRLGIKTDDEDLINQKVRIFQTQMLDYTNFDQPQKRKATDQPQMQRPSGTQLRIPTRADGRPIEADLTLLADIIAQKETLFQQELEQKVAHHTRWNTSHVDLTRKPLSPVHDYGMEPNFRPAKAHYLMTPPASVSEESSGEPGERGENVSPDPDTSALAFQPNSPSEEREIKAYRRRIGRLGRTWIDRKSLPSPGNFASKLLDERFKYDQGDDDEQPLYRIDPYDIPNMQFRASIPLSHIFAPRRPQIEAPPINNQPNPHPHPAAQGSASSPPRPSSSVPPQPQPAPT